jgi:hypothetical protein
VCTIAGCHPICSAVEDVDTREALVIGSYNVSAYRVAKNYRRNFPPATPLDSGAAPAEATRVWFAQFLADQVLTAEAFKEGYGERPEVTNEVRRMERHMLTQPAGPFYHYLHSTRRLPMQALDAPSAVRTSRFEVDILRMPKQAPAAQRLNAIFALESPDDHQAELTAVTTSGQAEVFSGTMEWPFAPFEEVAGVVDTAPAGRWQKLDAGDTIVALRVRDVHPIVLPRGVQPSPPAPELLEHMEHERIRKEHAQQILRESELEFDWSAAERWVARLALQNPDPLQPLDSTGATDMLTTPIARHRDGDATRKITIADYLDYYNASYIRFLPRKPLDLFTAVQAMIVARRDEREARSLGIDRQIKFVEDRHNYRAQLALDLYIKERIRPSLGVTEEEIARHYEANAPAFTRPTHIEGTVFTFTEINDAIAFARAAEANDLNVPSHPAHQSEAMILTSTTELPALPFLPRIVFSDQAPRVIGPFPHTRNFGVWIQSRITASRTLPLASVRQQIRTKLEQPRLETAAAKLARELSAGMAIQDNIGYAEYGVAGVVSKPWSKE